MEKLAIFDVDYTLTRKETLMELFKYSIKLDKGNLKYLPRAAYCGILYGVGVFNEKQVKQCFLKFIKGLSEKEVDKLADKFYEERLSKILYSDGINHLKKLKAEGYRVILISASPEFYMKKFYNIPEVDFIMGTRFSFNEDKFACLMDGLNCKGEEKVVRLKKYLEENNIEVDYENSHMYSDSLSDLPLLKLVGNPHLINYKKKHEYKILNWK